MNNKVYLAVIALLLLICGYLAVNLNKSNDTVQEKTELSDGLEIEREQLELDLQKMRFSYDTLKTENSLVMAEIAAQRMEIDDLLKKVKDKNWSITKLRKETGTLRDIMKGYIVTIDSLNQLNQALLVENAEMRDQVQTVVSENQSLLERQGNMEKLIATGSSMQITGLSTAAIRLSSTGKQRETNRAGRTEMIKACFTLLENRIAKPGEKQLYVRIIDPSGQVLVNKDGSSQSEFESGSDFYSVSRTVDYNNQQMDVCVFYTVQNELPKGDYKLFLYEGSTKIGSTDLPL